MEENNLMVNQSRQLMMPVVIGVGLLVIVLVVIGMFFVTSRDNPNQIAEVDQQTQPVSEVAGVADTDANAVNPASEAEVVEMEAGSFYYAPDEIRVKEGQLVKVIMTSKDMMHDFNIDELGVKMPITKAGETATVEFVANQKGEFEYYCSVGQHRLNGQVGKLIVE